MNISEKQKLYLDILEMVLPYLRGVQTHGFFRRIRYGRFYAESELVHNLPRLILNPEILADDIHWLNTQAKIFYDSGRLDFPFRCAICEDIEKLFKLVPKDLQPMLKWNGCKTLQ